MKFRVGQNLDCDSHYHWTIKIARVYIDNIGVKYFLNQKHVPLPSLANGQDFGVGIFSKTAIPCWPQYILYRIPEDEDNEI